MDSEIWPCSKTAYRPNHGWELENGSSSCVLAADVDQNSFVYAVFLHLSVNLSRMWEGWRLPPTGPMQIIFNNHTMYPRNATPSKDGLWSSVSFTTGHDAWLCANIGHLRKTAACMQIRFSALAVFKGMGAFLVDFVYKSVIQYVFTNV